MTTGQQVVCVDDSFGGPLAKYYEELPEKGKTYTIRAVFLGRGMMHTKPGASDGEVGLLLQELHNPPDPRHKGSNELGFNSMRFKPLEEVTHREATNETVETVGKELVYANK